MFIDSLVCRKSSMELGWQIMDCSSSNGIMYSTFGADGSPPIPSTIVTGICRTAEKSRYFSICFVGNVLVFALKLNLSRHLHSMANFSFFPYRKTKSGLLLFSGCISPNDLSLCHSSRTSSLSFWILKCRVYSPRIHDLSVGSPAV